jgi:hypothetical protein
MKNKGTTLTEMVLIVFATTFFIVLTFLLVNYLRAQLSLYHSARIQTEIQQAVGRITSDLQQLEQGTVKFSNQNKSLSPDREVYFDTISFKNAKGEQITYRTKIIDGETPFYQIEREITTPEKQTKIILGSERKTSGYSLKDSALVLFAQGRSTINVFLYVRGQRISPLEKVTYYKINLYFVVGSHMGGFDVKEQ